MPTTITTTKHETKTLYTVILLLLIQANHERALVCGISEINESGFY